MSELVRMYDSLIEDIYGEDYIQDRVLAIRLPYKIHIIYPSVIVNKAMAVKMADRIIKRLKDDSRFSDVLLKDEKIVDKSVYNTGLRMVGMHKSRMGKADKNSSEWVLHENLFGEHTYTHCYHFADPDTFEFTPMTLQQFKNASIRVNPEVPYTVTINEEEFSAVFKNKGKGKIRKRSGLTHDVPKNLSTLEGGSSTISIQESLRATIGYMAHNYNHLLNENDIIVREFEDNDGVWTQLIVPLATKECHFAKKVHASNHQFIVVDRRGLRQKCHDCPGHKNINTFMLQS